MVARTDVQKSEKQPADCIEEVCSNRKLVKIGDNIVLRRTNHNESIKISMAGRTKKLYNNHLREQMQLVSIN